MQVNTLLFSATWVYSITDKDTSCDISVVTMQRHSHCTQLFLSFWGGGRVANMRRQLSNGALVNYDRTVCRWCWNGQLVWRCVFMSSNTDTVISLCMCFPSIPKANMFSFCVVWEKRVLLSLWQDSKSDIHPRCPGKSRHRHLFKLLTGFYAKGIHYSELLTLVQLIACIYSARVHIFEHKCVQSRATAILIFATLIGSLLLSYTEKQKYSPSLGAPCCLCLDCLVVGKQKWRALWKPLCQHVNQHENDPYQICFGINSGQKLNIFPFMNARLNGWMVRTGTGGPGSCAVAVERFYASLYLYVCEYAFICAHTCLNIN